MKRHGINTALLGWKKSSVQCSVIWADTGIVVGCAPRRSVWLFSSVISFTSTHLTHCGRYNFHSFLYTVKWAQWAISAGARGVFFFPIWSFVIFHVGLRANVASFFFPQPSNAVGAVHKSMKSAVKTLSFIQRLVMAWLVLCSELFVDLALHTFRFKSITK